MTEGTLQTDRRGALVMTAGAAVLAGGVGQTAAAAPQVTLRSTGRDIPFDNDWRFHRGAATGFEDAGLDDTGWRVINLPHDWSIEDVPGGVAPAQLGPFDKTSKGSKDTGYTLGGEGWYRKHFRVDAIPPGSRVELLFDGVYLDSDVWLNGQHLVGNTHGYRPFTVDLTPALHRDADNVLAVRVRNLGQNSRWYAGSGIYRQVRMDVLPAGARIARWGVGASTRRIDASGATIDVTTSIEAPDAGLEVVTRLRDADGGIAVEARVAAAGMVNQRLALRAPHLWSPENPALYTLETELRRGQQVLDHMVQPFGIRIVLFDARRGMTINGTQTVLRGACIHHDNGLLGACAYPEADERKLRLIKARGYNAVRSSHNTPSRSLREACDRVGMLLIAEAFDAWHAPKLAQDFATHFKDDWQGVVEAMVLSGRNSPSIIMWSIGNEIPARSSDEGVRWQWELTNAVHRLDPTRPVTAGLNGVLGQPMIAGEATARAGMAGKVDTASTLFLDIPGYNYRREDIEAEQPAHPGRVVYASETFAQDVYDYWALANRAPYFLGEFVWTAMDYLGEAGIAATAQIKANLPYYLAAWPWVIGWCGDIDLIGQQKPPSFARDVVWGISKLEMAVQHPLADGQREFVANWGWADERQSWNWAGSEGKPLTVRIYSSADRIELSLNGVKVGDKTLVAADRMKAEFAVPYTAGVLEAVAWLGGKIVARRRLETAGAPARLRLVAETPHRGNDRQNLRYVAIEVLDASGRVIPDGEHQIAVTIEGPADLVGLGGANPRAVGSFQSPQAQTFRGRALAIVRTQGKPGHVRIAATSAGLAAGWTRLALG